MSSQNLNRPSVPNVSGILTFETFPIINQSRHQSLAIVAMLQSIQKGKKTIYFTSLGSQTNSFKVSRNSKQELQTNNGKSCFISIFGNHLSSQTGTHPIPRIHHHHQQEQQSKTNIHQQNPTNSPPKHLSIHHNRCCIPHLTHTT